MVHLSFYTIALGAIADRDIQIPTSWSVRQQRSAVTNRQKIRWCGFHDNKRYTNFRLVRTNWQGSRTNACTNALNSNPRTQRFSSRCCSCQRPVATGSISAHQALRFQANAVITM